MSNQDKIKRLEQQIKELEETIKNRAYYGSMDGHRCQLYYLKQELEQLRGAQF